MKRFDVLKIKELPVKSRFYFLSDKNKKVWEVISKDEKQIKIQGNNAADFEYIFDLNKDCVFLRINN